MTEHIAVVGAGIAGLCTALALSKQGHEVVLYERDLPPPDGTPDQAFFEWQRRGAAQFRHPHAFLGLMCSILQEHYPELLDDFIANGARKLQFKDMVPPHMMEDFAPAPEDESMWMLLCRRATLETVFRRHVEKQGNVQITNKTFVTGIETKRVEGLLHVTGLHLTDRSNNNAQSIVHPSLVVDATGRASKFRFWLEAAGAEINEQRDDAEIVYYTRHYRLKDGVAEPDRHKNDPAAGDLGYLKYGVFPGDSGHFALITCLPNHETELRQAVKDGDTFDSICLQIPGLVPWIAADKADPTTPPFGIGEIHAVWRDWVKDDIPQALNFFAVGDASARTNPLYGRGCSTGILHAQLLADVLARADDPVERALSFHKTTHDRIRPIFDASLTEDKNGIKRAAAVLAGEQTNKAKGLKQWFGLAFGDALTAAARYEMHVFRGLMRTVNLVEKPGDFLRDKKIQRTIYWYMLKGRKRNAQARVQRGPDRNAMLAHLTGIEAQS